MQTINLNVYSEVQSVGRERGRQWFLWATVDSAPPLVSAGGAAGEKRASASRRRTKVSVERDPSPPAAPEHHPDPQPENDATKHSFIYSPSRRRTRSKPPHSLIHTVHFSSCCHMTSRICLTYTVDEPLPIISFTKLQYSIQLYLYSP